MSNLGLYQTITTVSKRVGGPKNLIILTMIAGYGVIRVIEAGGKRVIKVVKKHNKKVNRKIDKIYKVTSKGKTKCGLELNIGDEYKILEEDGEAILIEKLEDVNSPYFVSADFLGAISDFTK